MTGPVREAAAAELVEELHETLGRLRCAATFRLVKLGVSMTHLHVLWLLQHHGDQPMSRIAELLDVSLSNATGLIDRMEERGLVERVRVPDDRRLVVVRTAEAGRRVLEEVEAVRLDRIRSIIGRLDDVQVDRLAQAFADVRAAIVADGVAIDDPQHTHH